MIKSSSLSELPFEIVKLLQTKSIDQCKCNDNSVFQFHLVTGGLFRDPIKALNDVGVKPSLLSWIHMEECFSFTLNKVHF